MSEYTGNTQGESFLPPVTFAEASAAQDCYFAVSAACRSCADDLARAARDETVTVHQMNAIGDKYMRLCRLSDHLYAEWQRLSGPPLAV